MATFWGNGLPAAQNRATTSTVYRIEDDRVIIPAWDDRSCTEPVNKVRFAADVFEKPAHIYRGRLILETGMAQTRFLDIPVTATEIALYWRATSTEGIFPRIRVSMSTETDQKTY